MSQHTPNRTDRANDGQPPSTLDVYFLGCVDFDSAWVLQQSLTEELAFRGEDHGKLLICEHPPMISIGREGGYSNLRYADDWLTDRHHPEGELSSRPPLQIRWVKRGGGALVHAPGQLAIYPIIPLASRKMNPVEYLDQLVQCVTQACEELRIGCETRAGRCGIFTRQGQVGFAGISVRKQISRGGIYLNLAAPLELIRNVQWMRDQDHDASDGLIEPANLAQARRISISTMRERIMHHVQRQFEFTRAHLFTSHPLLRRERRKVYEYA